MRVLYFVKLALKWLAAAASIVSVLATALLFGFLGAAVHWAFWSIPAFMLVALVGVACWWAWDRRRADAREAVTEVPVVADQPLPPPSPQRPAGKWRQACSKAARRIREVAQ